MRLPNDVAFPDSVREVTILKDGPGRIIIPAHAALDDFFDAPALDLPDRVQPSPVTRAEF